MDGDAVLGEVVAGRAVARDTSGRRDMVGSDGVEEQPEDAGAFDIGDGRGRARHVGEVGRVLHVGRTRVPAISEAALHLDLAPFGVAAEHIAVALLEHRLFHRLAHHLGDLFRRRPDVFEVDRLALGAGAERLGGEVDHDRAGQRVGDHERRRGEIVGAHVVIDASLEIAVAGEHGSDGKPILVDGVGDLLGQRSRIADAGGAAIADEIEPEPVQVLLQACLLQIIGHHLRARRERGLDPRLDVQAPLHGILGEQAGRDHHERI